LVKFIYEYKIWLILVAVVIAGFYVAYQFVPPPMPKTVKIATGREGGAYHGFALQYQQQLAARFKIKLEILPTAGSAAALEAVAKKEVDFAFVQGGVARNNNEIDSSNLLAVANLFYEPLWVFHRQEIQPKYLSDLRGLRVAIGEIGSGTRVLAQELLSSNGITTDNTNLLALSSAEAVTKLETAEIDAAFFVSAPQASWIAKLIAKPDIKLMHFERYAAYTKLYRYINHSILAQGSIDLAQNLPQQNTSLLAVTAGLVTHDDVHSALVRMLLHILRDVHSGGGLLEEPQAFPTMRYAELPTHSAVKNFLERGPSWLENLFPFGIAMQLERLSIMLIPLLTLLLPLLRSAPPIYRWSIRVKIYRWYALLREIDSDLETFELAVIDREIARLSKLHHELVQQVSVPLSYMAEFYTLRLHINLILQHLHEQRERILAATKIEQ
jgi:uncharacterized protein